QEPAWSATAVEQRASRREANYGIPLASLERAQQTRQDRRAERPMIETLDAARIGAREDERRLVRHRPLEEAELADLKDPQGFAPVSIGRSRGVTFSLPIPRPARAATQ